MNGLTVPEVDVAGLARLTLYLLWAGALAWLAAPVYGRWRRAHLGVAEQSARVREMQATAGLVEVELEERKAKYARATASTSASDASGVPEEYVIAREMMTTIVGEGLPAGLPAYGGAGWSVTAFIIATLRRHDTGLPVRGGRRFTNATQYIHKWHKDYRALEAGWKRE